MIKLMSLTLLLFIGCTGCNSEVQEGEQVRIEKEKTQKREAFVPTLNQFDSVWNAVNSDPLDTYPQDTVSYAKLFDGAVDLIFNNAKRTLANHSDTLPYFDKLAHPNGVCMRGLWEINTDNPYSGYFKNGSQALFIGRASSAMSNTKRGETRAFGMGGKLFATLDSTEILSKPSANFFVIDDLGGTDAEYFMDVELSNEPDVSFTSSVFLSLRYGLKVSGAFSDADENPGIRQLYEISYLGEDNTTNIITPKWMKIKAHSTQRASDVEDFRDEFILAQDETLVFDISVSSVEIDEVKQWSEIGTITFDASVVSTTCDHGLHFHHPLWRDDLVYE